MHALTKQPRGWRFDLSKPLYSSAIFRALEFDYSADNDPWGYAMSAAFKIASEVCRRGLDNPLDYHPGPFGLDEAEDKHERALLRALTDDALLHLARFTKRLLAMLERAGKDY